MRLKLNNCTYIVLSNQQLMKIPNELILNLKGCATSTGSIVHRLGRATVDRNVSRDFYISWQKHCDATPTTPYRRNVSCKAKKPQYTY